MTHAFRSWDDVTWLRRQWNGPLIIKGVMTAEDAQRALQYGVDGIIVSNHGGRQLDGVSSTIEALPEIVDAVDGRAEVFLDGGVRRGADVVKAIALGAKACLIGRPYWYGLAANGEEGAVQVLKIFHDEIERVLMLLGRRNLGEVDASAVRRPP
jgi:L-lactate dehydrogenase (cytochrome)